MDPIIDIYKFLNKKKRKYSMVQIRVNFKTQYELFFTEQNILFQKP
jgi:hypothetical protein